MKILLILPHDKIYRYRGFLKQSMPYAPLTLTTLALVPTELEAQIEIIDEGVQKPSYDNKRYDVVGITCVASSSTRAYQLAQYWRDKGSFVVLGGVHPTLMPEEAAQHADALAVGPGEKTWPQILRDFQNGTAQKIYQADYPPELSSPIARRDLLPRHRYLPIPTIIANRGCTNHCHYCPVHKVYGGQSVTRPIEEVIDEIKRLQTKKILLFDPSPTSNKEYAKNFFAALLPLKIKWFGLATTDVVYDRELFELFVRSGCEGLMFGFESLSQASMDKSGKPFNQVGQYKEVVEILHRHQITVLGCFVLGFDEDTPKSLARTAEIVEELNIDLPRYAVLTPFPGTNLFTRLKNQNRILTEDYSFYDSEHVVFQPEQMSATELQQILYRTWQKTYRFSTMLKRARLMQKNGGMSLLANLSLRHYVHKGTLIGSHKWN